MCIKQYFFKEFITIFFATDPDSGYTFSEVDPDPTKLSGSGWIQIQIQNTTFSLFEQGKPV